MTIQRVTALPLLPATILLLTALAYQSSHCRPADTFAPRGHTAADVRQRDGTPLPWQWQGGCPLAYGERTRQLLPLCSHSTLSAPCCSGTLGDLLDRQLIPPADATGGEARDEADGKATRSSLSFVDRPVVQLYGWYGARSTSEHQLSLVGSVEMVGAGRAMWAGVAAASAARAAAATVAASLGPDTTTSIVHTSHDWGGITGTVRKLAILLHQDRAAAPAVLAVDWWPAEVLDLVARHEAHARAAADAALPPWCPLVPASLAGKHPLFAVPQTNLSLPCPTDPLPPDFDMLRSLVLPLLATRSPWEHGSAQGGGAFESRQLALAVTVSLVGRAAMPGRLPSRRAAGLFFVVVFLLAELAYRLTSLFSVPYILARLAWTTALARTAQQVPRLCLSHACALATAVCLVSLTQIVWIRPNMAADLVEWSAWAALVDTLFTPSLPSALDLSLGRARGSRRHPVPLWLASAFPATVSPAVSVFAWRFAQAGSACLAVRVLLTLASLPCA